MADTPLVVDRQPNQIVVSGPGLSDSIDSGSWSVTRLDGGRLLLTSKNSGSTPEKAQVFGRCSIDVLNDLLVGLTKRHWTGMVLVDTGFGQKKIFFNHGRLCFAGSTLIDDRLGEVIYREEMITLDQLTNTAVQVDRSTKFGQVLLRDKVFSNTDLWNALKSQVQEIFSSIFLVSDVYVELLAGKPSTEVTFEEETERQIETAYCAGLQFRNFFKRLRRDAKVEVVEGDRVQSLPQGTFLSDMIQLARKHPSIGDLLDTSKLTDINTLWVLHRMSCLGYIQFSGLKDVSLPAADGLFTLVKSRLDAFELLTEIVLKAFSSEGVAYPLEELQKFAWSLNEGHLAVIYIDARGHLGPDCIGNILSQCLGSRGRIQFFESKLETLIRYVLSLATDLLPYEVSKSIRSQFEEISN